MADEDIDEEFGGFEPHVGHEGDEHEDIKRQEIVVGHPVPTVVPELPHLRPPEPTEQPEKQESVLRTEGHRTGEGLVARAIIKLPLTDKEMIPQRIDVLFIVFGLDLAQIVVKCIVVLPTQQLGDTPIIAPGPRA